MKKTSLFVLTALMLCQGLPAVAQYHYSYGDSRVVNQNQTGLYMPSSTYIGAGTMSRSAQGKGAGVGASLPVVNMGSHVRTAGDNLYNNDGTDRQTNGALIYKDQEAQMAAIERMKWQTQQRRYAVQQRRQMMPQGNLYIPGGGAADYGYSSGGSSYGGQSSFGARNF